MKYYVTIIKDDSRACYEYEDKTAAMASFHTEMAYACNAKISTLCVVVNFNGTIEKVEKYTAPPIPVAEAEDGEN